MSNASLLDSGEQIQESYTQQHRALKTLLGAFKNTSSALGKANRALRDYVAQIPVAPPESVEGAQQALSGLQLKDEILDPSRRTCGGRASLSARSKQP